MVQQLQPFLCGTCGKRYMLFLPLGIDFLAAFAANAIVGNRTTKGISIQHRKMKIQPLFTCFVQQAMLYGVFHIGLNEHGGQVDLPCIHGIV